MSEFLLELFSEEIPARMQQKGAEDLARLVGEALAPLAITGIEPFYGPRRIALAARVDPQVAASTLTERGPRLGAPEAALAGFLRKHGAEKSDLRQEGDFWVLVKSAPAQPAAQLIAAAIPALLRKFPWPKSMRWGGTSGFTWVRPLKRILCLLDGAVVPFSLAQGSDDGHGLASGNLTEGHRMMAPGAFAIGSVAEWKRQLAQHCVVLDAQERKALIDQGLNRVAAVQNVAILPDAGLLDEVAGLVEWPVPLLGRIDEQFMDLPPEVMQVSMRVNQRYFATRDNFGAAAPWFAFAANIEAPDDGATIIAGNERVLRARFSDARHFWDLDRKHKLASRVEALDAIVFHVKIGTQGERVRRLVTLARFLAARLGANADLAGRAALLCKADLTTGMVGEFPELQGVMGGYYAAHDGEAAHVVTAIREHYAPKGQNDAVPSETVAIAVALADKLDQLAQFFAIGEKPTGGGDPFALRRAALGVIRIIRENQLRLHLREAIRLALEDRPEYAGEILDFILDRLRVQLRSEGARHDVLAAIGADDDLTRLLARTAAVAGLLATEDGANLLAAYKRAANILRIEEKKDGAAVSGAPDPARFRQPEESALAETLASLGSVPDLLQSEQFRDAMREMARLRLPLDRFFDNVTVNDSEAETRANRLRLLARVRSLIDQLADFSRIEV